MSFVERTLSELGDAVSFAGRADSVAAGPGLLQTIDARAKVCGLGALLLAGALARHAGATLVVFAVGVVLAIASRVPWVLLAGRFWLGALFFSAALAVPALFLTPGAARWRVPGLALVVTAPGLEIAGRLVARALAATTLGALLVLTTPWPRLLKALCGLGVPALVVVLLSITQRYIFLFCRTALDMFEARRSRRVGPLSAAGERRLVAQTTGVLLGKSLQWSEEVHLAMLARGFRGTVEVLEEPRWRARDGVVAALLVSVAVAALWWGR